MVFTLKIYINLQQVNQNEKHYKSYHDKLYELIILNKSFNSYLLQQKNIASENQIASNIEKFRMVLNELIKNNSDKNYSKHINSDLLKIKKLFLAKIALIAKYKSYNDTNLHTLSYVLNFKNNIDNIEDSSVNKLFGDLVSELMKSYLNSDIKKEKLESYVKELSILKEKSKEFDYFYINVKSTIDTLKKISNVKSKALNIPLDMAIKNLHRALDVRHDKIVLKQNKITRYILIFTFLLLCILFYYYTSSIEFQKELSSFRYAVQNSDDSIVITDKDRKITYVNEAFTKNTGYSKEEAIGKNPNILKSGKLPEEFYKNLNTILNRGEKWSGDFINKDKNGNIYYEKASITPLVLNDKLVGYLAIKLNITNYIKEQKKAKFLAYHDSLTNLPNRRMMKKSILESLKSEDKKYLTLFFLDLDGFKGINDTLGHDVGDVLLVEVARKLKSYMNRDNSVFRTGGDEFAILYSSKDGKKSEVVAQEIIRLINEPVVTHDNILRVGISIGIARFNEESDDIISLLKHADVAMYKAKKSGKNRFAYYTKDLSVKLERKTKIEQKLPHAIKNGEFFVVYQPKYYLKTHEIRSIEALIRWNDKELGFIPPDLFIPIAEEAGFINKIGEFVFKRACEDFMIFSQKYKNLSSVSINVSPAQFMDNNLIEKLENIMKNSGVNPKNIGIEITETHLMQNIHDNSLLLQKLKELGCKIIIDDFGSGYSSLNYLKKLPIDNIKIDKTFIDDICTDESDRKIVKTIMDISRNFNYMSVAEGIETQEQEDLLIDIGVQIGQGYLFSKPKTRDELLKFFESNCKV